MKRTAGPGMRMSAPAARRKRTNVCPEIIAFERSESGSFFEALRLKSCLNARTLAHASSVALQPRPLSQVEPGGAEPVEHREKERIGHRECVGHEKRLGADLALDPPEALQQALRLIRTLGVATTVEERPERFVYF